MHSWTAQKRKGVAQARSSLCFLHIHCLKKERKLNILEKKKKKSPGLACLMTQYTDSCARSLPFGEVWTCTSPCWEPELNGTANPSGYDSYSSLRASIRSASCAKEKILGERGKKSKAMCMCTGSIFLPHGHYNFISFR